MCSWNGLSSLWCWFTVTRCKIDASRGNHSTYLICLWNYSFNLFTRFDCSLTNQQIPLEQVRLFFQWKTQMGWAELLWTGQIKMSQLSVSISRNGFGAKLLCLLILTAEESQMTGKIEWKVRAHAVSSSRDPDALFLCSPSRCDVKTDLWWDFCWGMDLGLGGPIRKIKALCSTIRKLKPKRALRRTMEWPRQSELNQK